MKKFKLILIVTLLITAFSCGPSVEGETKNWDRNIEQLKKMQKNYPAYADMIKAKITEAEKVYNDASSISDDEKKADKMREANNMLNLGCVGNLKNMSSKIDDVNKKKRELKNMMQGKSKSDIKFAEMVIDDSKDAVKKAEKVLNKKTDNLDANPCMQIEKAYKDLTLAYDDISNAISKINKAEADQQKKEDEIKAESEKKDEAPKMVECTYCGSMNEAGKTKCSSCGANLK